MSPENVALLVLIALPVGLGLWVRRAWRLRAVPPTSVRRTLAVNALVLAFLVSLAGLGGEIYFRFVFDGTDTFGILRSTDRWIARHYRYNAAGSRDDIEYGDDAPAQGRRRITVVGDSFTAGHGVPNVADRFVNRLRAARPEWEVHSAAGNGWDTGHELAFVEGGFGHFSAGRYETDVVLLIYCLNDIVPLDPEIHAFGVRLEDVYDKGPLRRSSWLCDVLGFLYVLATEENVRGYFPHLLTLYDGPVWDAQAAQLRRMRAAVESQGGTLATATFPMMHRLDGAYPLRGAHDRLSAFWADEGVPHLDLLDAFAGHDSADLTCGAFDAHPNEAAHAIAAEALAPFVDAVLGGD